ncbi:hypothetical protein [Clostridium sp. BNL1100]|uniref:hypothetical protein n=1 Tax=Clostridium sp. BNL1100 TaxID=755731 RepID=UPI00030E41F8|nr:hypothetical protein [Clostridium sp. BNL1100]
MRNINYLMVKNYLNQNGACDTNGVYQITIKASNGRSYLLFVTTDDKEQDIKILNEGNSKVCKYADNYNQNNTTELDSEFVADEKTLNHLYLELIEQADSHNMDLHIELIKSLNSLTDVLSNMNVFGQTGGFQNNNMVYPNDNYMLERAISNVTNALEKVSEVLSK